MMRFYEDKNVEIVNCNYRLLREKKEQIVEENKRKEAFNQRIKIKQVLACVIAAIVIGVITAFIAFAFWDVLLFNIDANPIFIKYPEIKPIWVKMVTEALVIVSALSVYRMISLSLVTSIGKTKKSATPIKEEIRFAKAAEDRIIGNLTFSQYNEIPYIGQEIVFSFDAVDNNNETDVLHFDSAASRWHVALIPGLFKTIIDVGNSVVYRPYYENSDAPRTPEVAYLREKILRVQAEEKIEQLKNSKDASLTKALRDIDALKNENQLLTQMLKEAENKISSVAKERDDLKESFNDASVILLEERAKNADVQNAIDKVTQEYNEKLEAKQHEFDAIIESNKQAEQEREQKINLDHAKATESYKKQIEEKDAALLAAEQRIAEMNRQADAFAAESEEKISKATHEKDAEIAALNQKIQELVRINEESAVSKKENTAELEGLQSALKDMTAERDSLLATVAEKEKTFEEEKAGYISRLEQANKEKIENGLTIGNLKNTLKANNSRYSSAESKLKEHEAREKELLAIIDKKDEEIRQNELVIEKNGKEMQEIIAEKTRYYDELVAAQRKTGAAQAAADAYNAKVKAMEKECADKVKKAEETIRSEYSQTIAENEDLKKKNEELEQRLKTAYKLNESYGKERDAATTKYAETKEKIKELNAEIAKLQNGESGILNVENKLRDAENHLHIARQRCEVEKAEREKVLADYNALQKVLSGKDNTIKNLESKLASTQAALDKSKAALRAAERQPVSRPTFAERPNTGANSNGDASNAEMQELLRQREEEVKKARELARKAANDTQNN